MADFPIIDDVEVTTLGLTLVDLRNLTPDQAHEAEKVGKEFINELLEFRTDTRVCDDSYERAEFADQHYIAARRRDPSLFLDDFERTAPLEQLVRDDSDANPRLPIVTFAVLKSREILGIWILYNMTIERDEAALTLHAMVVPAFRPPPGQTHRATASGVMRWILEEDLSAGGRSVDVVEWRFPSRASHLWTISADEDRLLGFDGHVAAVPSSGRKVADLDDHDFTEVDGKPTSVRRRGAPRSPR